MSIITLSCLVAGEKHSFPVDIDTNKVKTVGHLKDVIKENQKPFFDNVAPKVLKLWKVDISLEEENEKLELVNTKINVNIKEDLGGEKLLPLSKISKHFPLQPVDEHIHIIVQRPVETKEVHCTATYERKKNEHIVISRVIGGAGLKRKISTERKVIQFSADEDLMSIIWTTNPKVDLEIVVDTFNLCMAVFVAQQPFSSYTFPKMKAVFGLKADDYNGLLLFDGGVKDTPKEIRSLVIKHPNTSLAPMKPLVASLFLVIFTVLHQSLMWEIQSSQLPRRKKRTSIKVLHRMQTSIQRNPKKRSYDTAGLHEDVMYGIVSTAVDWVIIKLVSSSSENKGEGKVEVLLSSLSPSPLPINNSVLTREDLANPVENLFG
ncbi:hypothetical protein RclHR1_02880021 [Rhizophagus clarus]|uniref:Crinkler effector protein N-terminal domain-containing protein n=1 Tax=Rhizophagus clarus TaxID=94130 RepID=A0A2Z6R4I3_9GLOM|nr:hypothetical protein RclHR1_02880021 [Rhizophagus clarus]